MDTFNFWHKLYIYRKKIILSLIVLVLSFCGFAQQKKTYGMTRGVNNLPNYDDKQFHYGFSIGINSSKFNLTHSSSFLTTDTLISAIGRRSPGFSLGFIVSYRLGTYFDLRLLPTVAFYERKVTYEFKGRGPVDQISDNTFIEFPLMLKYKSQRRKNFRMYLVGGIKPSIEAGSKKKDKKPTELRTKNFDLAVDYGFGLDIYYPLFKFSPEIRISHGIINMMVDDPNQYAIPLNKLLTHTVTVYLHFE